MRLLIESKSTTVFYVFFPIAFVILIVVPINKSAAQNHEIPSFESAVFTSPLTIDNAYMPLNIGDIYVYRAETEDGTEEDTVTVTSDSRILGGVECRAVSDVVKLTNDVLDHVPTEETTDWFAQDDGRYVWYCGEDTIEHMYDDEGNFIGDSTEGSWNANQPGAEPGIVMLDDPMPGDSYRQEFLEGVAEDMAKVMRLNAMVLTEFDDLDNCLETKEWTPLELGSIGHKYYYAGLDKY
jgi:hypothetical protein